MDPSNQTDSLNSTQGSTKKHDNLVPMVDLGKIISALAHEIRNPLGTIRTSLFLINENTGKSGDDEDTVQQAIAIAERNVSRCDTIINELVDYSRFSPSPFEPIKMEVWLPIVIRGQVIPKEIEIVTDFPSIPAMPIDSDHLRHAIMNLLTNAVYAVEMNEDHPPFIRVCYRDIGDFLEVVIEDSGIGINAEKLEQIFVPLYSTRPHGLGLGLSIVKRIIEYHGGTITVTSKENEGTTVRFTLSKKIPYDT